MNSTPLWEDNDPNLGDRRLSELNNKLEVLYTQNKDVLDMLVSESIGNQTLSSMGIKEAGYRALLLIKEYSGDVLLALRKITKGVYTYDTVVTVMFEYLVRAELGRLDTVYGADDIIKFADDVSEAIGWVKEGDRLDINVENIELVIVKLVENNEIVQGITNGIETFEEAIRVLQTTFLYNDVTIYDFFYNRMLRRSKDLQSRLEYDQSINSFTIQSPNLIRQIRNGFERYILDCINRLPEIVVPLHIQDIEVDLLVKTVKGELNTAELHCTLGPLGSKYVLPVFTNFEMAKMPGTDDSLSPELIGIIEGIVKEDRATRSTLN